MKRMMVILLSLVLGAGAFAAANDGKEEYSIWDDFGSNWYIDAGAGVQTLFTPDFDGQPFGKQLTPSFHLGIGKWVNPFWGFHASVQGYSFNAWRGTPLGDREPFSPMNNVDINYAKQFRYYLRYLGVRADFRFSLLNIIAGKEREGKVYDLVPYVGLGYMHTFPYRGTTKENLLTGHLGLRNRFSVIGALDVNLDVEAGISDSYMHPVDRKYAASLSLTAGLSYYFGRKAFRHPVARIPIESVRYITDTVYVREVEVPGKERVIERVVAGRRANVVMASIRFDLNGTVPRPGQETQLVEVARFLNANPDAQVVVEGYADATSGTDKYNKELGNKRAGTVRDALVNRYKVDSGQIKTVAIGADEQRYADEPLWNCVAIIRLVK